MIRTTLLTLLISALCCASAHAVVTFDWATVGDPGNGGDVQPQGTFGAVNYVYRISKHEVTNSQYTEFLNAVDPTGADALSLYNSAMSGNFGGIEKTGVVDGARYIAQAGREQNPVTFISFFDAIRFTNWLHNGQGSGDIETGVYTIGSGLDEFRSANARYWIPSEDEWYKAAYYDPAGGVYYDFPTGTDIVPYSDNPSSLNSPDDSNVANFFKNDRTSNGYDDGYAVSGSRNLPPGTNPNTAVGAYSLAASPYGTFDQGGNAWEWNEAVVRSVLRGMRGGSWFSFSNHLRADYRVGNAPTNEYSDVCFRVATVVPEPSSFLLVVSGLAIACGMRPRWSAM